MRPLVLDTNIVLDLLVFQDPAIGPLHLAINRGDFDWIATVGMRDELKRVLTYPAISARLEKRAIQETIGTPLDPASAVLQQFDTMSRMLSAPGKAPVTCRDRDDQIFIDLAVAHQAVLLSKDRAVLCMKKRLLALGVIASSAPICESSGHR